MKSPEMAYRYAKEALATDRGKDFSVSTKEIEKLKAGLERWGPRVCFFDK